MEGWVHLGYPAMHQPGVEPVIFRSLVRRPSKQWSAFRSYLSVLLTRHQSCCHVYNELIIVICHVNAVGLYHDSHKPWWPQTMTATNHDGHNLDGHKVYQDGHSNEYVKTNSILLRNCQIHDIIGQISPSYVFGCHCLWPSWLMAVIVEPRYRDVFLWCVVRSGAGGSVVEGRTDCWVGEDEQV